MLVIRLQRTGRKNQPTFRVVLTEKTAPTKSGEQEILGHYLPNRDPVVFECDTERVKHWISKGAVPSDTVARLLKKAGMDGLDQYVVRYTKQKPKKEPPPEAAKPAPAPAAEAAEAPKEEAPAASPVSEEKPAEEPVKKEEDAEKKEEQKQEDEKKEEEPKKDEEEKKEEKKAE